MATGRWSKSCRCNMSTESREVGPTSHALAPSCCPCLTRPSGRRAHPECPRIARLSPQTQRRAACNRWRAAGSLPPPTLEGSTPLRVRAATPVKGAPAPPLARPEPRTRRLAPRSDRTHILHRSGARAAALSVVNPPSFRSAGVIGRFQMQREIGLEIGAQAASQRLRVGWDWPSGRP